MKFKKKKKKIKHHSPKKTHFVTSEGKKNRHVLEKHAPLPMSSGCWILLEAQQQGFTAFRKWKLLTYAFLMLMESLPCCSDSRSQPGEWEWAGSLLSCLEQSVLPRLQDCLMSPAPMVSPCRAGKFCLQNVPCVT